MWQTNTYQNSLHGGRREHLTMKADVIAKSFAHIKSTALDTRSPARNIALLPMLQFGQYSLANGTVLSPKNCLLPFIKSMNNKKTSGDDNISNFILRKRDHRTRCFLATLFNHCINLGYYPKKMENR